jgi:hypothetical protein
MFMYNWAVIVNNNKILGYVKSESETKALKIAQEKVAKNKKFFLERVILGQIVPEEKEFIIFA